MKFDKVQLVTDICKIKKLYMLFQNFYIMNKFFATFLFSLQILILMGQVQITSSKYETLKGRSFSCDKLNQLYPDLEFEQYIEAINSDNKIINITSFRKKQSRIIFLHNTRNHIECKILDVIHLEKVGNTTNLQMGSCQLNSVYDSKIIAVERNNKYLLAYKINSKLLKFEKIKTAGINCMVDGI